MESLKRYTIDPDDPRAPSEDEWARLSEHERRWIVDHLPSEFPPNELAPPEGDVHYDHVRSVRDALRGYFRRMRRKIYIGSSLPVYYPGERMFSVDALAVLDVEDGSRNSWVVSAEGRGLDVALEIHWLGHRKKDFERNVAWFPRLGITEYFVFDARHLKLRGFRLPEGGGAQYEPVVPQGGRYVSHVLGLDLGIEGPRLRFYAGSAPLPDADDLIARLDGALAESQARAEEEARRAEEEARRAEEEARRAEEEARRAEAAEQRLAVALAELERMKNR
ncbi:MAG TPA: Uma2 family endonuclease [Polyangiaceae bacterium]|nr:Uma2 family endonuclease [Polyangiaceae bacterium]